MFTELNLLLPDKLSFLNLLLLDNIPIKVLLTSSVNPTELRDKDSKISSCFILLRQKINVSTLNRFFDRSRCFSDFKEVIDLNNC